MGAKKEVKNLHEYLALFQRNNRPYLTLSEGNPQLGFQLGMDKIDKKEEENPPKTSRNWKNRYFEILVIERDEGTFLWGLIEKTKRRKKDEYSWHYHLNYYDFWHILTNFREFNDIYFDFSAFFKMPPQVHFRTIRSITTITTKNFLLSPREKNTLGDFE